MKKMLWALTLFSVICVARPGYAIPVPTGNPDEFFFKFEASGFLPRDPQGERAPQDPVSGSITYRAASINSPIEELLSIDLTIDEHTYTVCSTPSCGNDVGFLTSGGMQLVGGSLFGGVEQVRAGRDDFLLQWDQTTLALGPFLYATVNRELDVYTTEAVVTPVSEPATLPLAVLAMGLIAVFAGKRRNGGRAVSPQAMASC
jgi:PEP-CTERM motif-containing protein